MSNDQISVFDEMTATADAIRATVARLNREDLQIEFSQIIRTRRPDLSREEWLAMFEIWIGLRRQVQAPARGIDRLDDRENRRIRTRECAGAECGSVRAVKCSRIPAAPP